MLSQEQTQKLDEIFHKYRTIYFEYVDGKSIDFNINLMIEELLEDNFISLVEMGDGGKDMYFTLVIEYLCKKQECRLDNGTINEIIEETKAVYDKKRKWNGAGNFLLSYLYFGVCPDLMSDREANKYFKHHYFIWRMYDDKNAKHAPKNLELTEQNYKKYRMVSDLGGVGGWSNKQCRKFFMNYILPKSKVHKKSKLFTLAYVNGFSYIQYVKMYFYDKKEFKKAFYEYMEYMEYVEKYESYNSESSGPVQKRFFLDSDSESEDDSEEYSHSTKKSRNNSEYEYSHSTSEYYPESSSSKRTRDDSDDEFVESFKKLKH